MKKTQKEQYVNTDYSWFGLIKTYVKNGEKVSINHAELYMLCILRDLSKKKGFCYATDDYLASVLHVQPCTISKYIKQLKFTEMIDTKHIKKQRTERLVYILYGNIKKYIATDSDTIYLDNTPVLPAGNTSVLSITKGIIPLEEKSLSDCIETDQSKRKQKRKGRKPNPYLPSRWTEKDGYEVVAAISTIRGEMPF